MIDTLRTRVQEIASDVGSLAIVSADFLARRVAPVSALRALESFAVRSSSGQSLWQQTLESAKLRIIARRRDRCAKPYLSGTGLEIGALHAPLQVPSEVRVLYVDRATRQEAIKTFPTLDAAKIVEPDFVENGFELPSIGGATQAFVIACHVLEHASNPIQTLENWRRVLRPGGILFVIVPIADLCFDRGRPLTTAAHMVEDYETFRREGDAALSERNLPHYLEWAMVSTPKITGCPVPSQVEAEKRAKEMAERREEIHFHTFSVESFRELLRLFASRSNTPSAVVEVTKLGGEVLGVVRKNGAAQP